jgi:uncharacterized protein YjbI with pentapeptide repeats
MSSATPTMANADEVSWKTCAVEGCSGSRVGRAATCLAHLSPAVLERALGRITRDGKVDARGVEISAELFQRVSDALPRTPEGKRRLATADFTDATFAADANFAQTEFEGDAWFNGAAFRGEATFEEATFVGDAIFDGGRFERSASFRGAALTQGASFGDAAFAEDVSFAEATLGGEVFFGCTVGGNAYFAKITFPKDVSFEGATFSGAAQFGEATFKGEAAFEGATFADLAWFGKTTFAGEAVFKGVTFRRLARFERSRFEQDASFAGATFAADTWFRGATFAGDAGFERTTFERSRQLGPLLVVGKLAFDEASFLVTADLDLVADRLWLARARFPSGANVWVRWAEISLNKADFGAPSIVSRSTPFRDLDESALERKLADSPARSERPRLVSMRWANAEHVTVSGVDLSSCRFLGTHHLDGLRLEGSSSFAYTPPGFGRTRRQTIVEEYALRDWPATDHLLPDNVRAWHVGAREVAGVYRDLRKGREDNKDEPGAADFYYGEMEMRRLAGARARGARAADRPRGRLTRDRGEHVILTLYWLVSGYGLRASRALVCLALTVLVFGALLYRWGFKADTSLLGAITFSAESTTSLLHAPERTLTIAGEWLQTGLRLLGPLFFGLALLSLRGRVKR